MLKEDDRVPDNSAVVLIHETAKKELLYSKYDEVKIKVQRNNILFKIEKDNIVKIIPSEKYEYETEVGAEGNEDIIIPFQIIIEWLLKCEKNKSQPIVAVLERGISLGEKIKVNDNNNIKNNSIKNMFPMNLYSRIREYIKNIVKNKKDREQ